MIDSRDGSLRWIDFDYAVNFLDYDLWSLGNILTYVIGKGIITCRKAFDLMGEGEKVCVDDALVFYPYRLANLRKLYPYIPERMNAMLRRFSAGSSQPYADCSEISRELSALLG